MLDRGKHGAFVGWGAGGARQMGTLPWGTQSGGTQSRPHHDLGILGKTTLTLALRRKRRLLSLSISQPVAFCPQTTECWLFLPFTSWTTSKAPKPVSHFLPLHFISPFIPNRSRAPKAGLPILIYLQCAGISGPLHQPQGPLLSATALITPSSFLQNLKSCWLGNYVSGTLT